MGSQRPEEEQSERGFTVADKRLFTKEGRRRGTAPPPETPRASAPPPPRQAPPRREEPQPRRSATGGKPGGELPVADFATFVTGLATNAMLFLGQIPDPVTQQRRRDLPQAKHTIDILMMLREKTQGNLTPDEERLMHELLPQLQMAYVAANR